MTNTGSISSQRKETRALIIGSGISGLCAARVLSDYYDQVQIVERDLLPVEPSPRAGAPQSFHLHRLGLRGKEIMQSFFPGLIDELLERGAVTTASKKMHMANPFGEYEMNLPNEHAYSSKGLLEFTLRQRVRALPNTLFSPAVDVVGLQTNPDHTRIIGVHVRAHGQTQQMSTLTADLIIDASGQFSKITQWLHNLDYEVPEPERLKAAIGYSTRYYRISPQFNKEMVNIFIIGNPEKLIRSVYGLQIENDQWHVVLYGAGGHYPATDDNGFEQQLREAAGPVLADTLQDEAEPISSPRGYRIPECRRQHFEQMENWPTGLLVIGDALCNFDPIYGQGMTVAALEVEILTHWLHKQQANPQPDFERHVLRSFQSAIEPFWWFDAIADLRWSGTTYSGQEPPKAVALFQSYMDLYLQEATKRMQEAIKSRERHASHVSDESAPVPNLFSSEPSILSYSLTVVEFLLPPQVVFNATTYQLLLEIEAAQEGTHQLQELTGAYHLPLEEILNEILPTFSLPFMSPPAKPQPSKTAR